MHGGPEKERARQGTGFANIDLKKKNINNFIGGDEQCQVREGAGVPLQSSELE